jgi:hypothetical protein
MKGEAFSAQAGMNRRADKKLVVLWSVFRARGNALLSGHDGFWEVKPETASRVRGRSRTRLGGGVWLSARGRQSRSVAWQALPKCSPVAKIEHHRAMPYADLREDRCIS